jgi:hypothetical protein
MVTPSKASCRDDIAARDDVPRLSNDEPIELDAPTVSPIAQPPTHHGAPPFAASSQRRLSSSITTTTRPRAKSSATTTTTTTTHRRTTTTVLDLLGDGLTTSATAVGQLPRPRSSQLAYVDKFGRPVNLETFRPPLELSIRTCVLDATPQVAVQDLVADALQRLAPEPLPIPPSSFNYHMSPSHAPERGGCSNARPGSSISMESRNDNAAHRRHARADALGGSAMVRRWLEFQAMRPEDRVNAGLPVVYSRPSTAPQPQSPQIKAVRETPGSNLLDVRVASAAPRLHPTIRAGRSGGAVAGSNNNRSAVGGVDDVKSMFCRRPPSSTQRTSSSLASHLAGEPCQQRLQ